MNPEPGDIVIFTDGASRGNPGPGGFGAIVIAPKNYEFGSMKYEVREIGGREEHTTNNRMELTAAIKALEFVSRLNAKRLTLYADSAYLVNGITRWVHSWQKNGWRTKAKKEVENRDLWERLAELTRNYAERTQNAIDWRLVAGHVGVAGNTRCDEIARMFADMTQMNADTPTLYSGPLSDYPIKNIFDIAHDTEAAKKKSEDRTRQKTKAYSYVSEVDGEAQTHQTWEECERRVNGKVARYRKVFSEDEEQKLIAEWSAH